MFTVPIFLVQVSAVNAALNSFNKVLACKPYPNLCSRRYPQKERKRRVDELVASTSKTDEIVMKRMIRNHGTVST